MWLVPGAGLGALVGGPLGGVSLSVRPTMGFPLRSKVSVELWWMCARSCSWRVENIFS